MYLISGNEISLTRGDSFYCEVGIVKDDEPYTPQEGDTVRFYLKRDTLNPPKTEYADKKPIVTKEIPTDTMILHLAPEDTKGLAFGHYVYDCEITFANGDVDTFINRESFTLLGEVG